MACGHRPQWSPPEKSGDRPARKRSPRPAPSGRNGVRPRRAETARQIQGAGLGEQLAAMESAREERRQLPPRQGLPLLDGAAMESAREERRQGSRGACPVTWHDSVSCEQSLNSLHIVALSRAWWQRYRRLTCTRALPGPPRRTRPLAVRRIRRSGDRRRWAAAGAGRCSGRRRRKTPARDRAAQHCPSQDS